MTERMEQAIEYRDILRECVQLEAQIFGEDKTNTTPIHLIPAKKPGRPKGGARIKIDRGKLFALKNTGWTNAQIASDLGCEEKTVANIISDERAAAKEEGRPPKA